MDLLTLAKNVAQRVEAQATQAKVPVAVFALRQSIKIVR